MNEKLAEKIAKRIWRHCEDYNWGNGKSMLCRLDFERIIREEVTNEFSDLRERLGASILLRSRDYLEFQRQRAPMCFSVRDGVYFFDGIEVLTDHLLAHFRSREEL